MNSNDIKDAIIKVAQRAYSETSKYGLQLYLTNIITLARDLPSHDLGEYQAQHNPWHHHAPPPNTLVMTRGHSGNSAHPLFITTAYHAPDWRPLDPWRFPTGDALSDFGWKPTQWRSLTPDEIKTITNEDNL